MLDGLSDEDSGQLLVQLAEGYRKTGRLDLAADTCFFARRTPDHPLVDPALTWLIPFYASGEIAHRLSAHSAANSRHDLSPTQGEVAAATGRATATPTSPDKIQQAASLTAIAASSPSTNNLSHDDRLRRAAQLADYLKTARPPHITLNRPSALPKSPRSVNSVSPTRPSGVFYALRQLPEADPWRQCSAIEEWLDKPTNSPPAKKLANCRLAGTPPHLDGKLDDTIWEKAGTVYFLRASDSTSRTARKEGARNTDADVRVTHDSEFLYLAVHCLKADNVDYQSDDNPPA